MPYNTIAPKEQFLTASDQKLLFMNLDAPHSRLKLRGNRAIG
ncbi:hypothetical protein [Paenibacillus paeoniae]|nr:hypothetical protein [Paenibacillus paeoniae]